MQDLSLIGCRHCYSQICMSCLFITLQQLIYSVCMFITEPLSNCCNSRQFKALIRAYWPYWAYWAYNPQHDFWLGLKKYHPPSRNGFKDDVDQHGGNGRQWALHHRHDHRHGNPQMYGSLRECVDLLKNVATTVVFIIQSSIEIIMLLYLIRLERASKSNNHSQ